MHRASHRAPLATLKINVPRYSIESETRNRGKESRSVFVTYSTTIFIAFFYYSVTFLSILCTKKRTDAVMCAPVRLLSPSLHDCTPQPHFNCAMCTAYWELLLVLSTITGLPLSSPHSSPFSRGFFDRDTHSVSDDVARGAEGRKERKRRTKPILYRRLVAHYPTYRGPYRNRRLSSFPSPRPIVQHLLTRPAATRAVVVFVVVIVFGLHRPTRPKVERR